MKLFSRRKQIIALTAIVAVGAFLRILPAIPGWAAGASERFSRPDTPGYLEIAQALGCCDIFGGGTARPPGFPAVAAAVFAVTGSGEVGLTVLSVLLALLASALPLLVYFAGREYAGVRAGLAASALTALSLTAAANAPMLLSDTLFSLAAALQLWCFIRFVRRRDWRAFVLSLAAASLGALIRPINIVWILPALFILCCTPGIPRKQKLAAAILGTAVFAALPAPWMMRNAVLGAGYTLDTNTGAMYHQNGAMLLAAVNHSDFESEKLKIREALEIEFADAARYPDEKSREAYRIGKFRELIAAHPAVWISQHFTWKILLPDAPTFLENLGVTTPGRGTMGILARDGLSAAVRHYFEGKTYLLWLLLPLIAAALALTLGAAAQVAADLLHLGTRWPELLLFLAFVEYYLFLPGPITAPRYQLPALPFASIMAAVFFLTLVKRLRRHLRSCRKTG